MLESQIQSKILQYLKQEGYFCFKTVATNKRGIPDIFVLVDGVAIFLEVKTQTGRVSALQDYQMTQIRAAGGYVYVVRNLDDARKALANHTRKPIAIN